jgi:gag-polypeptide of LTR copia-type/Zinc knuckle
MAAVPATEWPQASIDALMRIHDPQLCLNDSNHRDWLQGVTAHLMRVQMDDILECSNPAAAAFRVFKGFIAVHVPHNMVDTVRAAANPLALMRAIADECAPNTTVHLVTMRTALSKLKQGSGERVSKYLDRGKDILHDLQAAGDTTTEAFVVTQLLMGLRHEFQDEAKHVQRTGLPHTFAAIAQPLRDAERTLIALGNIVYPDSIHAAADAPAGYAALLDYRTEKHALDDDADVLYAAGGKRRKGGQGRPIPQGGDTHAGQGRPVQSGHGGPAVGVGGVADVGHLITPELIGQALQIALSRMDRGGGARRGAASSGGHHNPNIVCLRCGQKGHIARECMAAKPMSAAHGGRTASGVGGATPHRVHFAMPLMHDLPGPLDAAAEADGEQVQGDEHAH